MAEAVELIAAGTAPRIPQTEDGASYEPMLNKPELTKASTCYHVGKVSTKITSAVLCVSLKITFDKPGEEMHNFIRGLDSVPGAWLVLNGEEVTHPHPSLMWN